MLKFVKSALWVSAVFGIILGGLAAANLWAQGVGVVLVGAPAEIVSAYHAISSSIFYHLFERWTDVRVPLWLKDFLIIWFSVGASNARAVQLLGGKVTLGSGFVATFIRVTGITNFGAIDLYRSLAVFVLGPLATLVLIFDQIKWLSRGISAKLLNFEQWKEAYKNFIKTQSEVTGFSIEELFHLDRRNFRLIWGNFLNLSALLFVICLNAIFAAGFLWWNSAEIIRVSAGVGG